MNCRCRIEWLEPDVYLSGKANSMSQYSFSIPMSLIEEVPIEEIIAWVIPVIDERGELVGAYEIPANSAASTPKEPVPGHCRYCGTKLHSEASLARGECAGCFADRKQIGPDRQTG